MRAALALASVSALVMTTASPAVGGAAETASSASQAAVATAAAVAATADDQIAAAQTAAVDSGEPVVVEELTTSTELTTALPDGTVQYEASSRPERAEKDGQWVPVDTELARAGDWWEPVASATPVRFSAGGGDELAQVRAPSGDWVSEVWPYGELPAPVVEGDTATYPAVFPGVDLKLVATKTGMASIYVVESEQAALSAPLEKLQVVVEGATLQRQSSGAVVADTGSDAPDGGELVAGQPLWWDSSGGGTYREPGGEGSPLPVEHTVTSNRMRMDVGESVRAAEEDSGGGVTYPIYVDPDWSSGINSSWYTDAAYPTQSYLSAGASNVLRVGIYQQYRSDMFFEFPLAGVKGKQIIAARLNTTQLAVAACGVQPITVYAYGYHAPGFTWNQEQAWNAAGTGGWWGPLQTPFTGPDCGSAPLAVGWNVTTGVQKRVSQGSNAIQFAFTYQNPNAPSRRHYSRDAKLIVTYNSYPTVPSGMVFTSPNAACAPAGAPIWASNSGSLTLRANVTDPDAQNVKGQFRVVPAATPSTVTWEKNSALAARGNHSVAIPAGTLPDGNYAWEARTIDAAGAASGWSSRCFFNVRSSGPASLPTISLAPGPYTVGGQTSATLTVDPDDGVAFIAYAVAPAAVSDGFVFDVFSSPPACGSRYGAVRIACPDAANKVTVPYAPTAGTSTIWAVSYDKAGNPARVPGKPVAEAGKHGVSAQVTAMNDPAVSHAAGHVWRTLPQASSLGASIPDSNTASPVALVLGRDTLRDLTANPQAPVIPLPKPVLGFADPATTGLTGPDFTASSGAVGPIQGSFTVAAWLKPGLGGGATAVALGDQAGVTLGLQSGAWRFCVPTNGGTPACATAPSAAGEWAYVAGVSDTVNGELRVYVDGALAGRAPRPSTATAVGSPGVAVGVSQSGGVVAARWAGLIADPAVFAGVATASQLIELQSGQDPADG